MLKLLVLTFVSFAATSSLEHCRELYVNNDPRPCCPIPNAVGTDEQIAECAQTCGNVEDECCQLDCIYEAAEVLVNGVVNTEKHTEVFQDFYVSLNSTTRDLWVPIFGKSMVKCDKILPNDEKYESTCKSARIFNVFACINQMNFLVCPSELVNNSTTCQAVRKVVATEKTCGQRFGKAFILDQRFWKLGRP